MKKLAVIGIICLLGLSVAGPAFAQPASVADITDIIQDISDFVKTAFFIIAIIFIILAAAQFVTAGGSPEAVRQARQKILYAIIGIAIALLANVFDDIIIDILG